MTKTTINLQGGIGNIMFQIACVIAYSKEYNKELTLSSAGYREHHSSLSSYSSNILSKLDMPINANFSGYITYNEPGFNYTPIPNFRHNTRLNGYYQSDKYFEKYEADIRELFSFDIDVKQEIREIITSNNTCSIHVRRGDYLNLPNHHPVQDMNYYMRAIKEMPKDSVFLIFSDDIKWCKENFPNLPEKFIFVEGNKDYEDMYIMSRCNNNIIANSSFSWWGAWLNENPDKIVISPSKDNWFGPAHAHLNTIDIIPNGWIQI